MQIDLGRLPNGNGISVRTAVTVLGRVGCVAGNIEDGAHDGYVRRIRRVGACPIARQISHDGVLLSTDVVTAVVPSCLASSSTLMGSSLGGWSFGGSFGANFLDSSWTCPLSAMADICVGLSVLLTKQPKGCLPAQCAMTFLLRYYLLIFLVNKMSYWTARLVGQRIFIK